MASSSPQKTVKPMSRWNFIQQAVASVESKLDNILAEDDDGHVSKPTTAPAHAAKEHVNSKRASADLSRSNSGTQANDRLQERLARAMAKKAAGRTDSPTPISEPISRSSTPLPARSSEDKALDSEPLEPNSGAQQAEPSNEPGETVASELAPSEAKRIETDSRTTAPISHVRPLVALAPSALPKSDPLSIDSPIASQGANFGTEGPEIPTTEKAPVVSETSTVPDPQQEEINGYIERIDALQAKLLYLSKEAAESARNAANSAEGGSAEVKLLEKDEKIALLMQEGQKLSKTEMKHLTALKKLRAQATTAAKEQAQIKMRAENAEKAMSTLEERANRAEANAKRAEENLATSLSAGRDLDAITRERNALSTTLADMKAQLARANTRAETAELKAQSDLLEKEKKRSEELQDDLTSARVERELSEEKFRREIRDLKASLDREREQSKAMETEMLGEQAILESKIESFRSRVEEASSNDHGGSQAKLLRQIETLQTQYANASQNWQGIEGTLLTRIASLEKERDDVTAREVDLRRKLRDVSLKAKQKERDLDESNIRVEEFDRHRIEAQGEVERSARKLTQLQEELQLAKRELEERSTKFEKDLARRIEEEKAKWISINTAQRLESAGPPPTVRKSTVMDMAHLMSPVYYERPQSRRSSFMPGLDSNTPPRQPSTTSFRAMSNGNTVETPSIIAPLEDEYFMNVPETPASQTHTPPNRGPADVISGSTVGAGPSVQLVERMSANVRRLESEKAATKDELVRLTSQRDEARQEVVNLMRELEQKRTVEERLKTLEDDNKSLDARYQTTLEMLGEKSEMVDELKADVADVKQMYRELVDTLK